MTQGIPIILSAPSGTGKSTIFKQLQQELPNLELSVSHTTRTPRPEERNGVDYFFIDEKEFKQKIHDGKLIEWTNVHNNFYGTSFDSVKKIQKTGNHIVLELDVHGADMLKKINFEGVYIMILPPSMEELHNRLRKRSTESEEKIKKRLETGKIEITHYLLYDYVITNKSIEESVKKIMNIIRAEESRSFRYIPSSEDIKKILSAGKVKH